MIVSLARGALCVAPVTLTLWLAGRLRCCAVCCCCVLLCEQGTYEAKRAKRMAKARAAAWRMEHPSLVAKHAALRAGAGVIASRRGPPVLSQHRDGKGVRGESLAARASRRPQLPKVDGTAFGRVRRPLLSVW